VPELSLLNLLVITLLLLALQPFRLSLSLVAFLALTNLDISGAWSDTSATVGGLTAIRAVFLPAWLLLRGLILLDQSPPLKLAFARILKSRTLGLWIAFVLYVLVASLWSKSPLAALKLLGALGSHTAVFLAFAIASLMGMLRMRLVVSALASMLALGVLQSYVLAGRYESHASVFWDRFTSFSSPQSFAVGVAALGSAILWSRGLRPSTKAMAAGGLLLVLILNGSRIGFLGFLAAIIIWVTSSPNTRKLLFLAICLVGAIVVFSSYRTTELWSASRVGELTNALSADPTDLEAVSTVGWRWQLYGCSWRELQSLPTFERIVGTGTSSSVILDGVCIDLTKPNITENRILHSEWLRVLLELGLLGALPFSALVISFLLTAWKAWRPSRHRSPQADELRGPVASVAPLVLLSLSFENVLQAAATPGTAGLLLLFARCAGSFSCPAKEPATSDVSNTIEIDSAFHEGVLQKTRDGEIGAS
jgi:hypothetical protein